MPSPTYFMAMTSFQMLCKLTKESKSFLLWALNMGFLRPCAHNCAGKRYPIYRNNLACLYQQASLYRQAMLAPDLALSLSRLLFIISKSTSKQSRIQNFCNWPERLLDKTQSNQDHGFFYKEMKIRSK